MEQRESRSPTPSFPTYKEASLFLHILDGVAYGLYRGMYDAIWKQRGSPQETADWANPDEWINERLNGHERDLALRIWRQSGGNLNPRHLRGAWYLAGRHDLLERERGDILHVTERGLRFQEEPAGEIVAEIDTYEGVLTILQLVAERGPGKRSEFLEDYSTYCRDYTNYRSETVIKGSLYDRLVNLIDRGYVVRHGQTYEVTDSGLAYLRAYATLLPGRFIGSQQSELVMIANEISKQAREQLEAYLSQIDPFKFEELIKLLLEEMGYSDVETTSPTSDKGVDVVANIELGISQVREVVQVKRHKGNIQRDVLDKLRGSLHRFGAVRGTIITTSGFSKGTEKAAFEAGAAPITLIDGDKLLNLLSEYGIGTAKKTVEYIEFDPSKLARFETKEEDVGL